MNLGVIRNFIYLILGLASRVARVEQAITDADAIPTRFEDIAEEGKRVRDAAASIDARAVRDFDRQ